MLSKEKIARINELSKLAKEGKLTEEQAKERTALRKEYLDVFRSTMRDTIEHVKVVDEQQEIIADNSEPITPKKVERTVKKKKIEKEKLKKYEQMLIDLKNTLGKL